MSKKHNLVLYFFLSALILAGLKQGYGYSQRKQKMSKGTFSAIFVFGDSTVDTGNNDYISTAMKSNFPPYGIDFPSKIPTGRFSNGRLVTDFIASYVGIKEQVPPYLDPTLSMADLVTGVSFASAASGYDTRTSAPMGVIGMQEQLEYFREYKTRVQHSIGKQRMRDLIRKAVFVVSAGTNDIGAQLQGHSLPTYLPLLLSYSKYFLQGLLDEGARIMVVASVPPMGCIPTFITLSSSPPYSFTKRKCVDSISKIARDFNHLLQKELENLQLGSPNHVIRYVDIYGPLDDMVKRPAKYGFEEVEQGCCGSRLMEVSLGCNPLSPVCNDRSKYMFWDATHPTQRAYYFLFQAVRPIVDSIANYS